jgi:hypothetical protein
MHVVQLARQPPHIRRRSPAAVGDYHVRTNAKNARALLARQVFKLAANPISQHQPSHPTISPPTHAHTGDSAGRFIFEPPVQAVKIARVSFVLFLLTGQPGWMGAARWRGERAARRGRAGGGARAGGWRAGHKLRTWAAQIAHMGGAPKRRAARVRKNKTKKYIGPVFPQGGGGGLGEPCVLPCLGPGGRRTAHSRPCANSSGSA